MTPVVPETSPWEKVVSIPRGRGDTERPFCGCGGPQARPRELRGIEDGGVFFVVIPKNRSLRLGAAQGGRSRQGPGWVLPRRWVTLVGGNPPSPAPGRETANPVPAH